METKQKASVAERIARRFFGPNRDAVSSPRTIAEADRLKAELVAIVNDELAVTPTTAAVDMALEFCNRHGLDDAAKAHLAVIMQRYRKGNQQTVTPAEIETKARELVNLLSVAPELRTTDDDIKALQIAEAIAGMLVERGGSWIHSAWKAGYRHGYWDGKEDNPKRVKEKS